MDRNRLARRRRLRPQIEAVEARCLLATLAPQDAIIGASAARAAYAVDGSGLTAAVIDTGVDYTHDALGGAFGAGRVVKAGYDFGQQDGDPQSTGWPHGTAVAGLIASRDAEAPGVAPGAEIVALRVFDDAGKGSFDWIADALQWVVDHQAEQGISVVNLSIADGKNYQSDAEPAGFAVWRIGDLVEQLERLNIPVVTAAGNSFTGKQGMGFTAIVEETISVSGTDADDRLTPDAQRLGAKLGGEFATDLVAPGKDVLAPGPNNSRTPVTGTSFAAPLVTGSVLLLQELYKDRFGVLPTVDQVVGWLKAGADEVVDAATGATFGRLDVAAAAALVPRPDTPAPPPPTPPPPAGGPADHPIEAPAEVAPTPPAPVDEPSPLPAPEVAPPPLASEPPISAIEEPPPDVFEPAAVPDSEPPAQSAPPTPELEAGEEVAVVVSLEPQRTVWTIVGGRWDLGATAASVGQFKAQLKGRAAAGAYRDWTERLGRADQVRPMLVQASRTRSLRSSQAVRDRRD